MTDRYFDARQTILRAADEIGLNRGRYEMIQKRGESGTWVIEYRPFYDYPRTDDLLLYASSEQETITVVPIRMDSDIDNFELPILAQ